MSRHTDKVLYAQDRLASMFGAYSTGDIWRSPSASGGKTGARTRIASDVSGWRRPATEDPRMTRLMPILNTPAARARSTWVLKVAAGTDIRTGDQWREDGVSYNVEGVAPFHTGTLCALSEIKGS